VDRGLPALDTMVEAQTIAIERSVQPLSATSNTDGRPSPTVVDRGSIWGIPCFRAQDLFTESVHEPTNGTAPPAPHVLPARIARPDAQDAKDAPDERGTRSTTRSTDAGGTQSHLVTMRSRRGLLVSVVQGVCRDADALALVCGQGPHYDLDEAVTVARVRA